MSVSYDRATKKWSFQPRTEQALKEVKYPNTKNYLNIAWRVGSYGGGDSGEFYKQATNVDISSTPIQTQTTRTPGYRNQGYQTTGTISIPLPDADNEKNIRSIINDVYYQLPDDLVAPEAFKKLRNFGENALDKFQEAKSNEKINREIIEPYNQEVKTYNEKLPIAEQIVNTTGVGEYLSKRNALKELGIAGIEDNFKSFYLTEKLSTWDSSLGAKPAYGDFDPSYYKQQNPELAKKYAEAVANDDVDVVNRYGENGFYLWHYTTQGKQAGQRGNAPEIKEAAQRYIETKPTDRDLENVRSLQLGVDMNTADDRLLAVPYINDQFKKALSGDSYWKQMAKDNFLSIDTEKPEEFLALFRLSKRPEDKEVAFKTQANTGYGVTELEDAINQAVGERATVDVKRFGALTQNVLKDTIEEIKKAKAKEQMFDLIGGLGGFSEIADINKTMANSIIGDSGIGGFLAMTGKENIEEGLEKTLQNITGIRNNVTYNWQQWFDNTLKKKYEKDLELGYTDGEAKTNVKIDAAFAKEFIEKYLQPRFDTARSMDEFTEYLDVRQEEQNPFQTQDLINAVTQIANLRSQAYLDQLKNTSDRYFDPEFYFNPTGNTSRESAYLQQAEKVNQDWEAAKKGDPYWAQQAYRFGIDLNNKADFAKIHFQLKGKQLGYDGAEDILDAGKVTDEIYNKILPALREKALQQGSIFGQFFTPEEFTNALLKDVDPTNQKDWGELLDRYGLEGFKGNVNELKTYITQVLRTGSAQKIREEIKYLNEKSTRPTQKNLGITYIERPGDYNKTQAKSETQLYTVFKNAGYEGSEDEFYGTMFPDIDRTEQQLLTKSGAGKGLEMIKLDTTDPFAALGSVEKFFLEDQESSKATSKKSSSFFDLDYGDDEDTDYKSNTGQKILSDFTSFFKGFS